MAQERKKKKMELADRRDIQAGLDAKEKVSHIARDLGRTASTVTDEIKRNRIDETDCADMRDIRRHYKVIEGRNVCSRLGACKHTKAVWDCPKKMECRGGQCKNCHVMPCWEFCPDRKIETCETHMRSPFVCNGCKELKSRRNCGHPYKFYIAEIADKKAEENRSASRRGLCITPDQMVQVIEAVKYGQSRNQSLDAIYMANPWMHELFSISTLYRWNSEELLQGITKLDSVEIMKRRTRKKPRKGEYSKSCVPEKYLETRTYELFSALPVDVRERAAQMDTVVGRRGVDNQCILTFQWKKYHFQLYVLLPEKSAESVVKALDMLQEAFGDEYQEWFGTLLTDQGSEFSDVIGIETNTSTGEIRSAVYYCDPFKSYQKPNCERQHEELRDVLPKGKSNFDKLTQADIALLTSNVNSYPLRSLGGFSALDLVWPRMGEKLELLGIHKIDKADVIKSPWLIPHAIISGKEPGKRPIERKKVKENDSTEK